MRMTPKKGPEEKDEEEGKGEGYRGGEVRVVCVRVDER